MKRIAIIMLFTLILLIILYSIFFYNSNKNEKKMSFQNLIQYKTSSINDEENLNKILENLEFGEYIIDTKKELVEGKEHLTIYFDCTDEKYVKEYYRNSRKRSIIEEDLVTLFALIDNLDKVTFCFSISDKTLIEENHFSISDNELYFTENEYTREMIEKYYNQDVREFVKNPNEFMNYNIDLNVEKITIYYMDIWSSQEKVDIINIEEQTDINNIVRHIKEQNFNVPDGSYNSLCNIWVDLNNGYIIGIYGNDETNYYGGLIKGSGKEIFELDNPNSYLYGNVIYKQLPKGLREYVVSIIENNK